MLAVAVLLLVTSAINALGALASFRMAAEDGAAFAG
jgi:hypothetical protein